MLQLVSPGVSLYRFTRDEYYRLGEMGLFENKRVELLEGQIVEIMPQGNIHALAVTLVQDALRVAFGRSFWVRCQMPLDLTPLCTPDPDLAVVAGAPRTHNGSANPTSALLVVEVSDSSLSDDRNYKSSLYAHAGIPEYWIVNLRDRQLEVRRKPLSETAAFYVVDYSEQLVLKAGDTIAPLTVPSSPITVADLLP